MPAMLPGAAWVTGAASDDATSAIPEQAAATTRGEANFSTSVTVIAGGLGLKVTGGLKHQPQRS